MRKYRNQILLGLIFALAIYIVLLLVADSQGRLETEGIIEQLRQFPLWLVMPLIGLQSLVIVFRFIEWHYYLGVIDARDKISLLDSVVIFVSTQTLVVSPGKAGELIKAVLLKTKTGVTVARSAPIVIAERVVDGIAVLVLMTATLIVAGDQLNLGTYNGIDYAVLSRTILFSSTAIIITGLIVIQIKPLAYFFLNLLPHVPIIKRLHEPLTDFYESSREIFALKHVVLMSMIGIGVYVTSSMGFVVILYGLGVEITTQLILQAMFIVGVASAVGALSFVPNGAGVTEISNLGMLLALVAPIQPLVTLPLAAAAALLQSFFHKWFRVIVGLLVAIIFHGRLFGDELDRELAAAEQARHKIPAEQQPVSGD